MDAKELIARRVAQELKDGDIVNLGIGIPTLVAEFIDPDVHIMLHSENGFIGIGQAPQQIDPDTTNAGGKPASIIPGGAVFDSVTSFSIVRGGHLDATVLGALEVDQHGNLANWMVPGKLVPGMGGAMDLVTGAKRVIIAMEHTGKDGSLKILKDCTLPLTGVKVVDTIITNYAVFSVGPDRLILKELAPGVSLDMIYKTTEAEFIVDASLKTMELG